MAPAPKKSDTIDKAVPRGPFIILRNRRSRVSFASPTHSIQLQLSVHSVAHNTVSKMAEQAGIATAPSISSEHTFGPEAMTPPPAPARALPPSNRSSFVVLGPEELSHTVDRLEKDVTWLKDQAKSMRKDIRTMDAKIDTKFGELDAKIDTKFGELDAKIDTKFGELDAKIDEQFGQLSKQLAELLSQGKASRKAGDAQSSRRLRPSKSVSQIITNLRQSIRNATDVIQHNVDAAEQELAAQAAGPSSGTAQQQPRTLVAQPIIDNPSRFIEVDDDSASPDGVSATHAPRPAPQPSVQTHQPSSSDHRTN